MVAVLVGQEHLHPLDLVRGQELRVVLVQAQLRGHGGGHLLAVSREHHAAADAGGVQVADGLGRVVLDGVGDDHVAEVAAVGSHVEDGAHHVTGRRVHAVGGHELGVAHQHLAAVDTGADAVAGLLGGVAHAGLVDLGAVRAADGRRDGVVAE